MSCGISTYYIPIEERYSFTQTETLPIQEVIDKYGIGMLLHQNGMTEF